MTKIPIGSRVTFTWHPKKGARHRTITGVVELCTARELYVRTDPKTRYVIRDAAAAGLR